jgi:hypothetical protein
MKYLFHMPVKNAYSWHAYEPLAYVLLMFAHSHNNSASSNCKQALLTTAEHRFSSTSISHAQETIC